MCSSDLHNLKPSTVLAFVKKHLKDRCAVEGDLVRWNQPKPPNPDDY